MTQCQEMPCGRSCRGLVSLLECYFIRSFHEDMQAEVKVGGALSESFAVRNGLRQGCTLAPTLFNLYFSAVVSI